MVAASAPRRLAGRPLPGIVARAAVMLKGLARPVRAPLANLASIPLHVAGLGCLDAAAFEWHTIAGLALTGLSLIWLEHVIADEP